MNKRLFDFSVNLFTKKGEWRAEKSRKKRFYAAVFSVAFLSPFYEKRDKMQKSHKALIIN